jgi:hypothetical protein
LLDWYAEAAINDVAVLDHMWNGELLAHHPAFCEDHFWLSSEFTSHTERLLQKMSADSNDEIAQVLAQL